MIRSSSVEVSDQVSEKLGKTPIRIFFLDNSSKMFLLSASVTAKELVFEILQKMNLKTDVCTDYFSLYISSSGSHIDRSVLDEELVTSIVSHWPEGAPSKLLFMIRLFMPSITGFQYPDIVAARCNSSEELPVERYLEEAEIIDRQLLHLQFIEAVYNVITGQYPTSADLALELGALQFLHKFGSYDASKHTVGFLENRIMEFIPYFHLRQDREEEGEEEGGRTLVQWEHRLLQWVRATHEQNLEISDRKFRGVSGLDPSRKYLEVVMLELCDLYGCAFFRCQQMTFTTIPSKVILAVHRDGLDFLTVGTRELLLHFSLSTIRSYEAKMSKKKNNKGLKDRLFCFELKQDSFDAKDQKKFKRFASFEVLCAEAATVCELIADYEQAAIHEKYRQRTLKSNHLGEDCTWKQPSLDDQIEACACVLIQSVYRGHKGRQEALEEKHALLGSRREQGTKRVSFVQEHSGSKGSGSSGGGRSVEIVRSTSAEGAPSLPTMPPPPPPVPASPPPPRSVWREKVDAKSGKPYWVNRSTKESTWHKPPEGSVIWKELVDSASGKNYYVNSITRESVWVLPEGV